MSEKENLSCEKVNAFDPKSEVQKQKARLKAKRLYYEAKEKNLIFRCDLCNKNLSFQHSARSHLKTKSHLKNDPLGEYPLLSIIV